MGIIDRSTKVLDFLARIIGWPVYLLVGAITCSVGLLLLFGTITSRDYLGASFSLGLLLLGLTWFQTCIPNRPLGAYGRTAIFTGVLGLILFFGSGSLLTFAA